MIPMRNRRLSWRMIFLLCVLGAGLVFYAERVMHHNALNAALIAAVERGQAADAEYLLHQGADADAAKPWFSRIPSSQFEWEITYSNVYDKGNVPQPVLCLAAGRHDLVLVDILLAHGANVNARSVHDYTALTYAERDAALTQDLLRHGANRSALDVLSGVGGKTK